MTSHRIEAIVLASTKTGERSLVVHCLSDAFGRRGFICSVSKSSSMALFLPLNIINAEVLENPRSDLWRIRNITSEYPLSGIRESLAKNSICLFMSEVLYRVVREGAMEYGLFDWFRQSVLTLDALESDYSNYHLRFLLEFASALGFAPTMKDLEPFAGECYSDLETLLNADFPSFMLTPLSGRRRSDIAERLLRYIGYHTETAVNVRSLAVLRELFGGV